MIECKSITKRFGAALARRLAHPAAPCRHAVSGRRADPGQYGRHHRLCRAELFPDGARYEDSVTVVFDLYETAEDTADGEYIDLQGTFIYSITKESRNALAWLRENMDMELP